MSFPEFTARVSLFSVISPSVFAPTHSFQPARVPAIRLSHLTDSQRMAFLVADNRLTENSSWDERMLGEQLKILSELELGFDLEAIGFEVGLSDRCPAAVDHRKRWSQTSNKTDKDTARTRPYDLCAMAGTISRARAVSDEEFSREILKTVAQRLKNSAS